MIALGAAGMAIYSHYGAGGGAGSAGCRHDPHPDPSYARFFDQRRPAAHSLLASLRWGGINLEMLLQGGLAGILLGVLTTFVGGGFNIRADRLVGGTGIAGAAASSTAGYVALRWLLRRPTLRSPRWLLLLPADCRLGDHHGTHASVDLLLRKQARQGFLEKTHENDGYRR